MKTSKTDICDSNKSKLGSKTFVVKKTLNLIIIFFCFALSQSIHEYSNFQGFHFICYISRNLQEKSARQTTSAYLERKM